MKTTNFGSKKGLAFGFSTVNAGQRQVAHEPQVIATSTEGGFRITPVISSLLGLQHGDYAMFLNNVEQINAAIRDKEETVVAFCEEQGLDIESPEAAAAVHAAFDMWGLAKGIKEYDTKGNVKVSTERLTKNDRIKFVNANFDEMLTAAIESAPEDVVAVLTREGVTREEQVEVLCPFVKARELPKFRGSKVANPAQLTGTGTTLNFTDSNVWNQLKADLGDEATKFNRIYDVDVKEVIEMPVSNGYEDVMVKFVVLGDYTDKAPARIGEKTEESAD